MTIFSIEKTCMRLFKSFKTLVECTTYSRKMFAMSLYIKTECWTSLKIELGFFLYVYVVCNLINCMLLCTTSFYDTLICLSNLMRKKTVLSSSYHHVTQRWNVKCNVSIPVYRLKPKTNVGTIFFPPLAQFYSPSCVFTFFNILKLINHIFTLLFSILNV